MDTAEGAVERTSPPKWSAEKFAATWDERKAQGRLDLVAWARRIGLRSLTTLYDWKNGKTEPRTSHFFALCAALGVEPTALLD